MYIANTNEYLLTIVDERGTHRLSVDDEDMARLMNNGAAILAEESLTRPAADDEGQGA